MRKSCENGRSMVEMLGVLAIIGVLSVGGIAGYSKAMFKHKMNQTLDMISNAVARMTELYNGNNSGTSGVEALKAIGVYPEDCVPADYDPYGSCELSVAENGRIGIEFGSDWGHIVIHIEGREARDVCVAFFSSGMYKNVPDDWWYPNGYIAVDSTLLYSKSPEAIANGAKSEITSADIADACAICADTSYGGPPMCRIYWHIKRL